MKNRFLIQLLAVSFLAFGTISCKKDKDDAPPSITDTQGIRTTLNWSHTNGTTALNSDIDVELYKGTGTSKISTGYDGTSGSTFESFDIPSTLEDGDYTIVIDFYDLAADGKMNLKFAGINSTTATYEVNDISFTATMNGDDKDVVKMTKSGNKFTFTKL